MASTDSEGNVAPAAAQLVVAVCFGTMADGSECHDRPSLLVLCCECGGHTYGCPAHGLILATPDVATCSGCGGRSFTVITL